MVTAARALITPELFGAILLHLSPKDLPLAQRTDKTFRNTMQGSIFLQKTFFFRNARSTTSNAPETSRRGDFNQFLLHSSDYTLCYSRGLLNPENKLERGLWFEDTSDNDTIYMDDQTLDFARFCVTDSGDSQTIKPSWLDVHLRSSSTPPKIIGQIHVGGVGDYVGGVMKVKEPTV